MNRYVNRLPARFFRSVACCLALFTGALLFVSCEGENGSVYYHFSGLGLEPTTTANGHPEVTGDTVPRSLFGLKLNLFPVLEQDVENFDPTESSIINTNNITAIRIWSNRPYNAIPAFGNLNSEFLHFQGNYFVTTVIEENGTIVPTAEYYADFDQQPYPSYTHVLALSAPAPGDYRFYVQLTLADSTVFIDSTDLYLLP